MSESYIVINGRKTELTAEQLKTLGIETKRKNPFEKVKPGETYYYIKSGDFIENYICSNDMIDKRLYEATNYFNDKAFAQQVVLHQLLYRKLLKFAYDNECEDVAEWNGTNVHYYIYYDRHQTRFKVDVTGKYHSAGVWFPSSQDAERAIKEVVEPFVERHPEFAW